MTPLPSPSADERMEARRQRISSAPPSHVRTTRARAPVLIIEDDADDAKLLMVRLGQVRTVAFDVVHVSTLAEASAWLSTHSCELIVLDLNLPDTKGLEGLDELRGRRPVVPVIVVSGCMDDGVRASATSKGAEEAIAKHDVNGRLFASCVVYVIERNRAREEERRVARILEANPDALVVVDSTGVVKYVNDQATVFFGKSREKLTDECLLFSASEGVPTEITATRSDGKRIGEMRVVELEWQGEQSFLASIRDVTEQRSLEGQLLLSDRLASLGTLAASVAHEINNPLAAILVNVELAIHDVKGDTLDALLDARMATLRIREIVRDLRLFSRSEQNTLERIELHGLLDSVIRIASNEVRHRARLVTEYGPANIVLANETRLSQVFLNLLVNAAQAIPAGNADNNLIRVITEKAADGRIVVHVEDSGVGIPHDVQKRMFEPFFTTKSAATGTGLGLAISRRIVETMGGEISFQSEPGRGTRFTVRLAAASPAMITRRSNRAPKNIPSARRRGRVLVVDDDPLIRNSIKWILDRDHDITCVGSAATALELISSGDDFDVILSDLLMPTMTGMDFHREVEAAHPEEAHKFVFMTAGAFTEEARQFLLTTSNDHVEKPLDLETLRRTIDRHVTAEDDAASSSPTTEAFQRHDASADDPNPRSASERREHQPGMTFARVAKAVR